MVGANLQDAALEAEDQLHGKDANELGRLGYAQELFRNMGGFSNFALSFSVISIVTGIFQQFDYGMTMGGPAQMALGWPLVCFFTAFVALSMAELSSGFPTSGAMYHWSTRLGGKAWGWFTAWFNIVGLITIVAGVDFGCAQFLCPVLGFSATPQTVLFIYALILVSHGLVNHFGIRLVAWLNQFSVTVHILGVVVVVGALMLFAPHQPIQFFFDTSKGNPQYPYLWAFVLGLLMAQWTMTGYDASAQVTEETKDPRHRVPWGMVISVLVSAFFGYLMLFALTMAVKDVPTILSGTDAGGNHIPAVVAILQTALGARAGSAVTWLAIGAMWFCGLASVTSVSRLIYAFSRDAGIPLSHQWKRVSPRFGTPSRAIWLCVAVSFALLIFSLTDKDAFTKVTSLSVIAITLSYITPVFLNWRNGFTKGVILKGPWNLGRWSRVVSAVAILWALFIAVVMVMPQPSTGGADPYLAGKMILSTGVILGLWYAVSERHRFPGPAWLSELAE